MTAPPPMNGGYQPKSTAGKILLGVFIAAILIVLLIVFIAKH